MHIVVTGASSGIGAALARAFAADGHSLTLVARRAQLLGELASSLATKTHVVAHDLADPRHATDWIGAAEDALGPIDVLVNNAGVQIIAPSTSVDPEEGERLLALNLLSPLRLTRAVLPKMIARKSGTIVDVSSLAALAPMPGMIHYDAAKAGLAAASEALRGEVKPSGVHVVTVYPGIIATTEMAKAGLEKYEATRLHAMMSRGTDTELARLVKRAVDGRQDRVIYPRSGLLTRWFPSATRWFVDRFSPPLRQAAS